jgi:hypothetical protein
MAEIEVRVDVHGASQGERAVLSHVTEDIAVLTFEPDTSASDTFVSDDGSVGIDVVDEVVHLKTVTVPLCQVSLGVLFLGAAAVNARVVYVPADKLTQWVECVSAGPVTLGVAGTVSPETVVGQPGYDLEVNPAHPYAVSAELVVCNFDQSERIIVEAGVALVTGDYVINFGTEGTVMHTDGSDLSWGGSGNPRVISAAGGTYIATLQVTGVPEG